MASAYFGICPWCTTQIEEAKVGYIRLTEHTTDHQKPRSTGGIIIACPHCEKILSVTSERALGALE